MSRPADANLLDQSPLRATFNLEDPAVEPLPLLYAFRNAAVERPGPMRLYVGGRYGRWMQRPWQSLVWGTQAELKTAAPPPASASASASAPSGEGSLPPELTVAELLAAAESFPTGAPPFGTLQELIEISSATSASWLRRFEPGWSPLLLASTGPGLTSNGYNLIWTPLPKPVQDWRCRRRPVVFARHGGEQASFPLIRCDGSVAPGALDRLSIMARPPEAPSPGEFLPDEPDAEAWQELEWVPQVRVLHPRLLWALQKIADAFPYRAVYIFSGYRPRAEARKGHNSLHAEGRAMDIMVMGTPNVSLFKLCRTLEDVGCGYYPNSKFVHVDVRRPATGHAFWIDISGPGEPSRYVDAWPGVVERGATSWSAQGAQTTAPLTP
ncbi:YcbK family protein [Chondromyces apiculatus]|uniref:Putative exported protein n=1 Tax=Chondromyces apiculatus DSM 436 TaxID=1192034 RepID=A0A017T6N7_9BACT|nr:D-Ala-D-Ala carboxypeptidase family metallohydrolase [Chondromyces apiculatus]EYF04241.1 putative exported protein [Chondromyces apiculatus DSM 436]